MSLNDTLEPLHTLADEIRDAWSSEGHAIDQAIDQHEAFARSGRSVSALSRDLLIELIERCAGRCGLWARTGSGGAVEILLDLEDRVLVMRVRSAARDEDGEAVIIGPKSGELSTLSADVPYKPEELWVFAFVRAGSSLVELFAAPILDITDHTVPRLVLGHEFALGHPSLTKPPGGGGRFIPTDEDLDDDVDEDVQQDARDEGSGLGNAEEGLSRAAGA